MIAFSFFLGLYYSKNGELMIPDRLGYFLDDFRNFENVHKIWTRRPPSYHQNSSNDTRKLWGHPGKDHLCKSGTQFLKCFGQCMPHVPCFLFSRCRACFCVSQFDIICYEDEDREMINFPLTESRKAWI